MRGAGLSPTFLISNKPTKSGVFVKQKSPFRFLLVKLFFARQKAKKRLFRTCEGTKPIDDLP